MAKMSDKTKKIISGIAWGVLAVDVVALIVVGGATAESVSSGVVLTSAIVAAVSSLVAFIIKQISK